MKWLDALGVSEPYQVPDAMMKALMDGTKRHELFSLYLSEFSLDDDPVNILFQQEHGDRDKFKQDYTPPELARLVAEMAHRDTGKAPATIADLCAGTGTLTLACLKRFPRAFYHCEEVTARAIPFLLFNLAIRGVNAEVFQQDVLTREVTASWRLIPDGKGFSDISACEAPRFEKYDLVVSNPPYSLKWEPFDALRWRWGQAPKKAADFAFVETGLYMLSEKGQALYILPHGVLFRGQAESSIRQSIICDNLLKSLVGVPNNLFLNTSIPVCIMDFSKAKADTSVMIVDGSKHFEKRSKQNFLRDEDIAAILSGLRQETEYLSHCAPLSEIQANDFNLNIPRYVCTEQPEELPPLADVLDDLADVKARVRESEQKLLGMLRELSGLTKREREAIERCFA